MMSRYLTYFIGAILFITPTIGFAMSDATPEPVAIYSEDCGPDDAPVTRIIIPEISIDHAFCQSIDNGGTPGKNDGQIFATGDFSITVHANAGFWDGKKIEGDTLKQYVWADMCGVNSYTVRTPAFELQSVQYLAKRKSIALQYLIRGKTVSKTLNLRDSGEKRPESCG